MLSRSMTGLVFALSACVSPTDTKDGEGEGVGPDRIEPPFAQYPADEDAIRPEELAETPTPGAETRAAVEAMQTWAEARNRPEVLGAWSDHAARTARDARAKRAASTTEGR